MSDKSQKEILLRLVFYRSAPPAFLAPRGLSSCYHISFFQAHFPCLYFWFSRASSCACLPQVAKVVHIVRDRSALPPLVVPAALLVSVVDAKSMHNILNNTNKTLIFARRFLSFVAKILM